MNSSNMSEEAIGANESLSSLTLVTVKHIFDEAFFVAFRLAVDINDYDLFVDLYHAATRRKLHDLAGEFIADG